MRRIVKGQEPEDLRVWKEQNAAVPQNLTYSNMPKAGVKSQMLVEQGYLCAYTMQRIATPDECHIEHIVPRSQDQLLQISYSNLVVCMPGNRQPGTRPERGKCPFGAEEKDQTRVDEKNFVSPLRDDVEHRFHYSADGSVTHIENDGAAESTIRILRLNHERLVELRKAVIEERVLDLEPGLSALEAEDLSRTIMVADAAGRIPEFCLAISHVAVWFANMIDG
jgi:uncharacterized protein (TIGR02646 family)